MNCGSCSIIPNTTTSNLIITSNNPTHTNTQCNHHDHHHHHNNNNNNNNHIINHTNDIMDQSSPRVLALLSSLLEQMVAKNEEERSRSGSANCNCNVECHKSYNNKHVMNHDRLTIFHGLRAPSISVEKYVERIFKYANCSPSCFVAAYAYLDRFVRSQLDFPITSLNIHRLLITSVMVAAKFLDDSYYNNAYYAKVGGVSTHEMNRLELEFLFRLGFRLHLTLDAFHTYCAYLHTDHSQCHVHVRGPQHYYTLLRAKDTDPDSHTGSVIVTAHGDSRRDEEDEDEEEEEEEEELEGHKDKDKEEAVRRSVIANVRHVSTSPSVKRQQAGININNHLMEPVS